MNTIHKSSSRRAYFSTYEIAHNFYTGVLRTAVAGLYERQHGGYKVVWIKRT